MWGCIRFDRQPLPRNIHRVADLTEKRFWGINLVIGYRSTTEKYSQTIMLVIILAARVSVRLLFRNNRMYCVLYRGLIVLDGVLGLWSQRAKRSAVGARGEERLCGHKRGQEKHELGLDMRVALTCTSRGQNHFR